MYANWAILIFVIIISMYVYLYQWMNLYFLSMKIVIKTIPTNHEFYEKLSSWEQRAEERRMWRKKESSLVFAAMVINSRWIMNRREGGFNAQGAFIP